MDLSNKLSTERVMNMTLDEYIHESGIFRNPIPPHYKSSHDTEDRFTDVTDEIVIKEEDDFEMLEAFDLRNKISSNNPDQPNISSQQWRLLPPNKSHSRPSGMPPLVPKDRESIHFNFIKKAKQNNQKWGNKWNRNNRYRRLQQKSNTNNGHIEENSQSKVQRSFNQQSLRFGGKNNTMGVGRRNGFDQWNPQNRQTNQTLGSPLMNMTIEPPVCNDSLVNSSFQCNNSSVTNQPLQNGALYSSLGILQPSSILDASGGIKLELMPFIAGKLLEALQGTKTVNTSKYDLKVQKEIHELQNKTMIYKCPGGSIISSDGPGLTCKMTPASTGISLNQRFA